MKGRIVIILAIVMALLIVGSVGTMAEEAKKTPTPKAETKKSEKEETKKEEVKKIDINSATQKELETLSGIGPKLAQAIIAGRPYKKIEDILEVKGIGKKKLAKIKDLIEAKPLKKKTEKQEETKEEKKKETKKEEKK